MTDQLRSIFVQTLSRDSATRQQAEKLLVDASKTPRHLVQVLLLVANSNTAGDAPVREAAAVHFKNIVKKGWDTTSENNEHGIVISEQDRQTIKSRLVEIMCTVPPQIQVQCSESISLIASTDYPDKWNNLLSELVGKFNSTDLNVVLGVLQTANSLFKRFRYVDRSDELYKISIYALNPIILALFKQTSAAVFTDVVGKDVNQLVPRLTALEYMCRIFYSLNYQVLPEDFEDYVAELIKSRRKDQNKQSRKDKVAAARMAKRDAGFNARRGMQTTAKPRKSTKAMEIDKQINREPRKSTKAKQAATRKEWMDLFNKFLRCKNPFLVGADEENESSPLDKLQAAIIANLILYADKDEEPFIPYLQNFTSLVWNLLITTCTKMPKHDELATTSIRFLSSLVRKLMHKELFNNEGTLRQIISNIVIPNLTIRESDEEKFEDDPADFILTDIEGSDSESRRKCSQELLRAMCRQFEVQTTAICKEHMQTMLTKYGTNPAANWKAKDVAILLMFGISIKAESTAHGVSQVNEGVNVMEFFTQHIYTELQQQQQSQQQPMLKSTSIKFVSTFRNQFTKEQLVALLPLLIQYLSSSYVVVHTYAAYAIERILTTMEEVAAGAATGGATTTKRPKFTSSDLQPFLESLFTALFSIVDNAELNENEYVMKCVMRSLVVADQDVIPVTHIVLEKLTSALGRVAKNPRNPQYNHYMFESIAVLVKSACSSDANLTANFEGLLFPPFQIVLQMDVSEFTPYVFQVLAQLLEYRPPNTGLGYAYTGLLPPCLAPVMWDRKGNIPALTRLLNAYLLKASQEIVNSNNLNPMLGVFQKLLSSKANEVSAFQLLSSIIQYVPLQSIQPHLEEIFRLLLVRLQASMNQVRFKQLTNFFALFVGKHGSQLFMDTLNSIQAGVALNLIVNTWLPTVQAHAPTDKVDAKTQVIGLTRLLCSNESGPALLQSTDGQQKWMQTLVTILTILGSSATAGAATSVVDIDDDIEISYDATFSSLRHASKAKVDPFADVADPSLAFVQSLHALCQSQSNVQQTIQASADPKLLVSLNNMFQKARLHLQK